MTKNSLPRPGLAWMSHDDIRRVRDRILGLFLSPGQQILVAPPGGFFGVSRIEISGGAVPLFEWERVDGVEPGEVVGSGLTKVPRLHKAWLKIIDKDAAPHWDFQVDENEVVSLPFNAEATRLVASLIKLYSRHFPFHPSENYFLNNGKFIA